MCPQSVSVPSSVNPTLCPSLSPWSPHWLPVVLSFLPLAAQKDLLSALSDSECPVCPCLFFLSGFRQFPWHPKERLLEGSASSFAWAFPRLTPMSSLKLSSLVGGIARAACVLYEPAYGCDISVQSPPLKEHTPHPSSTPSSIWLAASSLPIPSPSSLILRASKPCLEGRSQDPNLPFLVRQHSLALCLTVAVFPFKASSHCSPLSASHCASHSKKEKPKTRIY